MSLEHTLVWFHASTMWSLQSSQTLYIFVVEGVWIILSPAKNCLSLSIVNERPSWFAWFKAFKSETYVTSLGFSSCCSKSCRGFGWDMDKKSFRSYVCLRDKCRFLFHKISTSNQQGQNGSKWFSLISSSCVSKVPGILRPLILKIMFVDCACE